jgi:diketogulonate reductase-like aldo/keto reductase
MLSIEKLSKIGIGTWGLGGFAERDSKNNDTKQIEAATYMFNKGMNFFEVSMWAAGGHSARIMSEALDKSDLKREDVFITQAIYDHNNETFDTAKDEVNQFLKIFNTKYLDVVEFSPSAFNKYGYENVIQFLHELLDSGQTRYIGTMNASLNIVEKLQKEFKDRFIWLEQGYNFEIREIEREGIFEFARKHNILNIVYQPLRRNRTANRNWELLVELSEKYDKTQNQIILNWIVSKGYKPITKSETLLHIDEALESLEFEIEENDLKLIDEFKPKGYSSQVIDWKSTGDGVNVSQLSNIFDENNPV